MKNLQSKVSGYAEELVKSMNDKGLKDSDIVRAGVLMYAEKVLTKTERTQAMNRAKSNLEKAEYEEVKKILNFEIEGEK